MARTKVTAAHVLAPRLNIRAEVAEEILGRAPEDQMSLEEAAAIYRSEHPGAGPSSHDGSEVWPFHLQNAVSEMGLPRITRHQAVKLLRDAEDSLERAVELYVENPSSAGPSGETSSDDDEPIIIDSSSDDDQEGNQEDADGSTHPNNAAPYPDPRGFAAFIRNNPTDSDSSSSSSSSSDDDDDTNTSSDRSDDSLSDSSYSVIETDEQEWALASAGYDQHFKQGKFCS